MSAYIILTVTAVYCNKISRINEESCFLATYSPTGDKYNKAREWGINCVNAKWLGDIVTSTCTNFTENTTYNVQCLLTVVA